MAVTFAIYVAGGITGAHINPAVTIAFASFGGFPGRRSPGYIVAQILGGVAGAALVYAVYRDSIQAYESQNDIVRDGGAGSIGIFVTGPARYFGDYWGPFLTEVVGTAFLLLFVFAVVDLDEPAAQGEPGAGHHRPRRLRHRQLLRRELRVRDQPGPRLRPAAPRLFMGWGDAAFPGQQGNLDAYWWVPVVAPIIGGVIGAAFYEIHHRRHV